MPPVLLFLFAVVAVVSAVFGIIQAFRSPQPARITFGFTGSVQGSPRYGTFGPLDNTVSNELAVPVVYGRIKLAGNVIWQSEGDTQISRIVAICEGQIQQISDVRANDLSLEVDTLEAPGCTITKYLGTTAQTTDSRVPSSTLLGIALKPNMELHNLAYIAATLVASDELKGGNPAITSVVCGLLVETWNGTSWDTDKVYSRNPAAIIRDFLINDRYGLGIPRANIDDDSFGEVYEYCSEVIGT